MGRVKHAHKGAQVAPFSDHAKPLRKKKPYKVVMEMVTQEKKKLHTKMAYSVEPPRGYSFVELGDRDLTEYCREQCRKQNLVFHVVSARHKKRGSSQLEPDTEDTRIDSQLIGHHFPFAVIEQACRFLGYVWGRRGFRKIVSGYGDDQLARSVRNAEKRLGRKATENESKEQIRTAILEVFPKVPKSDLENIVRHAFEKGTKRVGNAAGMSLARRTQLAVGAYTRHQYTDYDKLLKDPRYTWKDARNMVEPASYAKLKEWRGEGDTKELEETFREIIVLDDDESSSDEDESPSGNGRSSSLEIFSSQATGREPAPYEHIRTGPPAYGVPSRGRSPPLQPYAGSYPGHAPPAAHSVPQPVLKRTVHPYVLAPEHNDLVHRHTSRVEIVNPLRRPPPPKYFRDKDGRLYELQPIDEPSARPPVPERAPSQQPLSPRHANPYLTAPPGIRTVDRNQAKHGGGPPSLSRRSSGQDAVLPSIERDPDPLRSPGQMGAPHSCALRASGVVTRPPGLHDVPQSAPGRPPLAQALDPWAGATMPHSSGFSSAPALARPSAAPYYSQSYTNREVTHMPHSPLRPSDEAREPALRYATSHAPSAYPSQLYQQPSGYRDELYAQPVPQQRRYDHTALASDAQAPQPRVVQQGLWDGMYTRTNAPYNTNTQPR